MNSKKFDNFKVFYTNFQVRNFQFIICQAHNKKIKRTHERYKFFGEKKAKHLFNKTTQYNKAIKKKKKKQ